MGGLAAGMPGKFALASAWKTVATVLCIASDHDTGAVVPAPTSSIRAKVQAWNYVLGAPQINEIPIVSTLGKILVKEVAFLKKCALWGALVLIFWISMRMST